MLYLTAKDLERMLAESDKKIAGLKLDLSNVQSEISELSTKSGRLIRGIKIQESKSEAIKEARIIIAGVPKKISVMRRRLLVKIERSKREDITINEQRNLVIEAGILTREIKKICTHPFVFHKDGYSGSPSQDYENGYPSERYCVVCGFEEKAKDFAQNGRVDMVGTLFDTLKETATRIVNNEPFRPHPECLGHVNIWVPLGAAIKPFEESVVRVLNSNE